nr:MAG TPA: hypothetical protein [Crassvirales sp.]
MLFHKICELSSLRRHCLESFFYISKSDFSF